MEMALGNPYQALGTVQRANRLQPLRCELGSNHNEYLNQLTFYFLSCLTNNAHYTCSFQPNNHNKCMFKKEDDLCVNYYLLVYSVYSYLRQQHRRKRKTNSSRGYLV